MDPVVQMDPPYFAIKEAVNQIQNSMVSSKSQTKRKTKIENNNILISFDILYIEVFEVFWSNKSDVYFKI